MGTAGRGVPLSRSTRANTPAAVTGVAAGLAEPVLLLNLQHMRGLLFNRRGKPQAALLGCTMTAGAISAGLRVVIPWRIRNQAAALDPIHVVGRRGDEVRFVHDAFHVAELWLQVQHHGGFEFSGMAHAADLRCSVLLQSCRSERTGGV
jgi:hypothetical protein